VPAEPGTSDAASSPLLEPLRADPAHAAVLTDVDGTLAPIVAKPELAAVPARARKVLAALSERYSLVGCVSGRRAAEARRLVGVDGIAYAGNHGLELLWPGETEPSFDPALERPDAASGFVAELDHEALAGVGIRVEDKGPIQALHWRGAADEASAEVRVREIAGEVEQAGLHPHWGRKVLELRPLAAVGKDTAVKALISSTRSPFIRNSTANDERAIYAGDDTTDLDAFRGLRELRDEGALVEAVCVGVVSPEAPPELAERSDLTVAGPEGWLGILESLAG
jgi:trehalose 6-phosphate phosphatase